eukprot:878904-Alexandrium_andersonii.AAC.1
MSCPGCIHATQKYCRLQNGHSPFHRTIADHPPHQIINVAEELPLDLCLPGVVNTPNGVALAAEAALQRA